METHYDQIAIQWLFFFFLLAIIFTPAFRFRTIAIRKGKKGLVFFLVGLFVGWAALNCGRLFVSNLETRSSFQPYHDQMWIVLMVVTVVIDAMAIITFSRTIK